MKKGFAKYLVIVLLALSAFTVNHWLVEEIKQNQNPQKGAEEQVEYLVTQIIDGDTIKLENGDVIRYLGINTPELNPQNNLTPECFAQEAKEENQRLVLGKKVRLEKDISDKDDYGRYLRYIWVDNELVNHNLLRNGFAKITNIPPDLKYENLFSSAQKYAQENNLGLWQKCPN